MADADQLFGHPFARVISGAVFLGGGLEVLLVDLLGDELGHQIELLVGGEGEDGSEEVLGEVNGR
ncbi:MAG: hypothetical protein WCJ64_23230 [Rhodospirillaceae bacterium]